MAIKITPQYNNEEEYYLEMAKTSKLYNPDDINKIDSPIDYAKVIVSTLDKESSEFDINAYNDFRDPNVKLSYIMETYHGDPNSTDYASKMKLFQEQLNYDRKRNAYDNMGVFEKILTNTGLVLGAPVFGVQSFLDGVWNLGKWVVGETAGRIFNDWDAAENIKNSGDGLIDLIFGTSGNEIYNELQTRYGSNGSILKVISDVGYNIGNMAPMITANILLPGSGVAAGIAQGAYYGSMAGNLLEQTHAENPDLTFADMLPHVAASVGIEFITEHIFGDFIFGEGLMDPAKLATKVNNPLLKGLTYFGLRAASEASEEMAAEILDTLSYNMFIGHKDYSLKEVLYAGLVGGLVGVVGDAFGIAISKKVDNMTRLDSYLKLQQLNSNQKDLIDLYNKNSNITKLKLKYAELTDAQIQEQHANEYATATQLDAEKAQIMSSYMYVISQLGAVLGEDTVVKGIDLVNTTIQQQIDLLRNKLTYDGNATIRANESVKVYNKYNKDGSVFVPVTEHTAFENDLLRNLSQKFPDKVFVIGNVGGNIPSWSGATYHENYVYINQADIKNKPTNFIAGKVTGHEIVHTFQRINGFLSTKMMDELDVFIEKLYGIKIDYDKIELNQEYDNKHMNRAEKQAIFYGEMFCYNERFITDLFSYDNTSFKKAYKVFDKLAKNQSVKSVKGKLRLQELNVIMSRYRRAMANTITNSTDAQTIINELGLTPNQANGLLVSYMKPVDVKDLFLFSKNYKLLPDTISKRNAELDLRRDCIRFEVANNKNLNFADPKIYDQTFLDRIGYKEGMDFVITLNDNYLKPEKKCLYLANQNVIINAIDFEKHIEPEFVKNLNDCLNEFENTLKENPDVNVEDELMYLFNQYISGRKVYKESLRNYLNLNKLNSVQVYYDKDINNRGFYNVTKNTVNMNIYDIANKAKEYLSDNTIDIGETLYDFGLQFLETLKHETEHAMETVEGLYNGANANMYAKLFTNVLSDEKLTADLYNKIRSKLLSDDNIDVKPEIDLPYLLYFIDHGEILSRANTLEQANQKTWVAITKDGRFVYSDNLKSVFESLTKNIDNLDVSLLNGIRTSQEKVPTQKELSNIGLKSIKSDAIRNFVQNTLDSSGAKNVADLKKLGFTNEYITAISEKTDDSDYYDIRKLFADDKIIDKDSKIHDKVMQSLLNLLVPDKKVQNKYLYKGLLGDDFAKRKNESPEDYKKRIKQSARFIMNDESFKEEYKLAYTILGYKLNIEENYKKRQLDKEISVSKSDADEVNIGDTLTDTSKDLDSLSNVKDQFDEMLESREQKTVTLKKMFDKQSSDKKTFAKKLYKDLQYVKDQYTQSELNAIVASLKTFSGESFDTVVRTEDYYTAKSIDKNFKEQIADAKKLGIDTKSIEERFDKLDVLGTDEKGRSNATLKSVMEELKKLDTELSKLIKNATPKAEKTVVEKAEKKITKDNFKGATIRKASAEELAEMKSRAAKLQAAEDARKSVETTLTNKPSNIITNIKEKKVVETSKENVSRETKPVVEEKVEPKKVTTEEIKELKEKMAEKVKSKKTSKKIDLTPLASTGITTADDIVNSINDNLDSIGSLRESNVQYVVGNETYLGVNFDNFLKKFANVLAKINEDNYKEVLNKLSTSDNRINYPLMFVTSYLMDFSPNLSLESVRELSTKEGKLMSNAASVLAAVQRRRASIYAKDNKSTLNERANRFVKKFNSLSKEKKSQVQGSVSSIYQTVAYAEFVNNCTEDLMKINGGNWEYTKQALLNKNARETVLLIETYLQQHLGQLADNIKLMNEFRDQWTEQVHEAAKTLNAQAETLSKKPALNTKNINKELQEKFGENANVEISDETMSAIGIDIKNKEKEIASLNEKISQLQAKIDELENSKNELDVQKQISISITDQINTNGASEELLKQLKESDAKIKSLKEKLKYSEEKIVELNEELNDQKLKKFAYETNDKDMLIEQKMKENDSLGVAGLGLNERITEELLIDIAYQLSDIYNSGADAFIGATSVEKAKHLTALDPKTQAKIKKFMYELDTIRSLALLSSPVSWVNNWLNNVGVNVLDYTAIGVMTIHDRLFKVEYKKGQLKYKEGAQNEKVKVWVKENFEAKTDSLKIVDIESGIKEINRLLPSLEKYNIETKMYKERLKEANTLEKVRDLYRDIKIDYDSVNPEKVDTIVQSMLKGNKYNVDARKHALSELRKRAFEIKQQQSWFGKLLNKWSEAENWGLETGIFGDLRKTTAKFEEYLINILSSEHNLAYFREEIMKASYKKYKVKTEQELLNTLQSKESLSYDEQNLVNILLNNDSSTTSIVELTMREEMLLTDIVDECIQIASETFFKSDTAISKFFADMKKKYPLVGTFLGGLVPFTKVASSILTSIYKYSPASFVELWIKSTKIYRAMVDEGGTYYTVKQTKTNTVRIEYKTSDGKTVVKDKLTQAQARAFVSENGLKRGEYTATENNDAEYTFKMFKNGEQVGSEEKTDEAGKKAKEKKFAKDGIPNQADTEMFSHFSRARLSKRYAQAEIGTLGFVVGAILAALGVLDIDDDDYMGISLKLGDYKIALSQFAPSLSPIALGGSFVKGLINGDGGVTQMMNVLYDQTILSLIDNVFRYSSPKDFLANYTINYATQFIPAIVKLVTKYTDPHKKDKTGNYITKLGKTIGSYLPGLSFAVPNKINPYTGKAVTLYNTGDNAAGYLLNALFASTPFDERLTTMSPMEAEAKRLGVETYGNLTTFTFNDKKYNVAGNIKVAKDRAKYINNEFSKLLKSGKYKSMSTEDKQAAIRSIYSKASELAKINYWTSLGNYRVFTSAEEYNNYKAYLENTSKIKLRYNGFKGSKYLNK